MINNIKDKKKIGIEDINFFQLCIDTIGYNKSELLKNMFGYDAEFMKMVVVGRWLQRQGGCNLSEKFLISEV